MKTRQLDINKIECRLSPLLHSASIDQLYNGYHWYGNAHDIVNIISARSGLSIERVCAIVAVLSPRNKWSKNIADAIAVIFDDDDHGFSTYGRNVDKAYAILNGEPIVNHLKGQKVTRFYKLLLNPFDGHTVCIDTWSLMAALGFDVGDKRLNSFTPNNYALIATAYRNVAKRHKLLPCQAQAIIWVVIRESYYDLEANVSADDVNRQIGEKIAF